MSLLKPIRDFFFRGEALTLKQIEVDVQKNAVNRLYRDNEKLHEINSDLRRRYSNIEGKLSVIYDDYNKLRESYNVKNERMSELVTVMTQIHGAVEKSNEITIGCRDMILQDTRHLLTESQMNTFADEALDLLNNIKDEVITFTNSTDLRDGIEEVRSLVDETKGKLEDICMDNIYDAISESTEDLQNNVRAVKDETDKLYSNELQPNLDGMEFRLRRIETAVNRIESLFSWLRGISKTVTEIHDKQGAGWGETQQKILDILLSTDKPLTAKHLREITGLSKNQVGGAVSKLIRHGNVRRVERGVYEPVRKAVVDLSLLEELDPNIENVWICVGEVIKAEGMNYGEWHQWSMRRTNYSKESCARKWHELEAAHGDKSHSWDTVVAVYNEIISKRQEDK